MKLKNTENPPIVIEVPGWQPATFRSREELAEWCSKALRVRGGILDSLELRALQVCAALANGETPPEVKRAARATALFAPDHPETRLPTPFDERIRQVEAQLEEADRVRGELLEARRKASGTQPGIAVRERQEVPAAWTEADFQYARADEDCMRLRARRNALLLARDRYRFEATATFHNPDDPSRPLTLAQVRARHEEEPREQ